VPDSRLPVSAFDPQDIGTPYYRIMRKGSLYNILGPDGRLFTKYKSASIVGPLWEELSHTPWPYESTAYERGLRLWQLGLIQREQVGKRHIMVQAEPLTQKPTPKLSKYPVIIKPLTILALPAPRIDLDTQIRLMQALRRNPVLLFDAQIQQALRHEVEYHRPDAKWALHLLKLLARYERQQRHSSETGSAAVLEKHIAWQEQRVISCAGKK
jgi:hypothetical protein